MTQMNCRCAFKARKTNTNPASKNATTKISALLRADLRRRIDDDRQRGLTPIVFDFEIPVNRDVSETVKVLAGLAKFVVADVTDATEVRAELHNIVKEFPSLPIQPLVLVRRREFISLPKHLTRFPWVLPTFKYKDLDHLLANLENAVIAPAVSKQLELVGN